MLHALLVPEGPPHAAHEPATQSPFTLPSAHAEPFGVHGTEASPGASEAESPPSALDEASLASRPESGPPPELDELLLASAPESEPPLEEEDPSPASPPEPEELLLESGPESLAPLELPEELLELEEPDELEEEDVEEPEPPESSPPPLDVASPPSSPLPPGPVEPLPPHPFTPVTSPQPASALNATHPRSEPNRRMRPSHHQNQARGTVPPDPGTGANVYQISGLAESERPSGALHRLGEGRDQGRDLAAPHGTQGDTKRASRRPGSAALAAQPDGRGGGQLGQHVDPLCAHSFGPLVRAVGEHGHEEAALVARVHEAALLGARVERLDACPEQ